METIWGRRSLDLDLTELNTRLTNYTRVMLDLGTGDGRYVHHLADSFSRHFIIGVDSCRENLREYSRAKLPNALFVIANAQSLPCELSGLVSHITINFPWRSLLESLLAGDSNLICGLESVSPPSTTMDIRLNGGALTEAGTTLERGAINIHSNMLRAGWQLKDPVLVNTCALQKYPTTWARRLAHGRDLRAMALSGYIK